jgi:hypothetical protein
MKPQITLTLTADGHQSTLTLTPRQSRRLSVFAQENKRTVAETVSLAITLMVEEDGPSYAVPDGIIEEDRREATFMRSRRN